MRHEAHLILSKCSLFGFVSIASVVFWPSKRPKMPFQGDAPEGSDTF